MSRLPVRLRLTLAFTAVMAVVLVAVGLFVYARVGSDLDEALDQSLRTRADDLAAVATTPSSAPPDERLVERDESLTQMIALDGNVVDATPGHRGAAARRGNEREQRTRAARSWIATRCRDSTRACDSWRGPPASSSWSGRDAARIAPRRSPRSAASS